LFRRSRESGFYCKEQKFREKLERIKQGLMGDLLIGKVRVNRLVDGSTKTPREA